MVIRDRLSSGRQPYVPPEVGNRQGTAGTNSMECWDLEAPSTTAAATSASNNHNNSGDHEEYAEVNNVMFTPSSKLYHKLLARVRAYELNIGFVYWSCKICESIYVLIDSNRIKSRFYEPGPL